MNRSALESWPAAKLQGVDGIAVRTRAHAALGNAKRCVVRACAFGATTERDGHPASPMVEQAEKARTAFAQKRSRLVGGFQPDVMMYIASALQTFKKGGEKQRQAIALEIAMLGRTGLDINDPTDKYTLKALTGKFSGLHLLAIMYTAFRQIDPTMDTGADFAAEYQAAAEMQSK